MVSLAVRAAFLAASQAWQIDACADNLFKQWVREGKVIESEMGQMYDDARRYCATVMGVEDDRQRDSEQHPAPTP